MAAASTTHQVAPGVTVTTHGDLSNLHYSHIIAFNTRIFRVFTDDSPVPDGKKEAAMAIDISGSMDMEESREQLQIVFAELTKGTNAEGKCTIPAPDNLTGLVDAVAELQRIAPTAQFKCVITDGMDNQYCGKLAVGTQPNGEYIEVDVDTTSAYGNNYHTQSGHVADHIEHVMGTEAFIVGIGAPEEMLDQLSNRRATVIAIPRGTRDPASIVGAVRHGRRVRQSGTATNRQILVTTDEAQAIAAALEPAEVEAVTAAAGVVQIAQRTGEEPPAPCTKEHYLARLKEISTSIKNPIEGDEEFKKYLTLNVFFAQAASTDEGIPGAALFGKFSGLLEPIPKSDLKQSCNQTFSRLCAKDEMQIFEKAGTVGDGGAELDIGGRTLKFSKGCDMYKCLVPADVLSEIAADRELTLDMKEFKTSANKSPKKRAREGPEDPQPARASPGADADAPAATVA